MLPRRTLNDEFAEVQTRKSAWSAAPLVEQSVNLLQTHLPRPPPPLVFSNGDYNPLNVIVDSDQIGWVDFEHAGFEDPWIGMPKFWFWADDSGWAAGARLRLIERHLERHPVRTDEFAARVLLRGLTHLHDTTPEHPPTQLLATMTNAIKTLSSA